MEANSKSSTSKKPEWIECESKKNPGKKYLFNKATGESKWLSSKMLDAPIPTEVKKALKAPANERLKRLQQKLRTDGKSNKEPIKTAVPKKPEAKNNTQKAAELVSTCPSVSTISSTKKILNVSKPQDRLKKKDPIVAAGNIVKAPMPPQKPTSNAEKSQNRKAEATKRAAAINDEIKEKNLKKVLSKISKRTKIPKASEKVTSANEKVIVPTATQKALKKTLIAKDCEKSIKEDTVQKESFSFKVLPKIEDTKKQQTIANLKNHEEIKSTAFSKPQEQLHNDETDFETPELKFLVNMPNYNSTPTSHSKRSANGRLERFRQKLQKENKIIAKNHLSDQNSNIFTNSALASNTVDLGCEEMDWEPSVETTANFSFGASDTHCATSEEPTKMEVDNNLMLNAADKTFEASISSKWRYTHLYVVLDTNIFVHQLSFIENLKNVKPIDAPGVILYVPYSVLQELDKLKLRDDIKDKVRRAVRFLNKMFETKDDHVQAQSAFENRRHIIDIEGADDSILNCYLQVREHIPQVVLLSEDINLRNKAMCNDINVCKQSDLLQTYFQKSKFP